MERTSAGRGQHAARNSGRLAGLAVIRLLGVVAVATLGWALPVRAYDAADLVDPYEGVVPDLRDAVLAQAEQDGPLDTYRIAAEFDPDAATIGGRIDVLFVNRTGQPLDEIYLRLYPNDPIYLDAGMAIERLRVGTEVVGDATLLLAESESVLRAPLARTLASGEDINIRVDFTTSLMTGPFDLGYFLGQDAWSGTWLLEDWYPVVAPWRPETGWYLDAFAADNRPSVRDNALYDVSLIAPDKLVIVATGEEVDHVEHGRDIERRWVTGPARDFAVVADDDYGEFTAEVGGTRVTAYADWEYASMVNYARQGLGIAVDALVAYGERFGPYPYSELDVIVMPRLFGTGFAVSGMIFVSVYYDEVGTGGDGVPDYDPDERFFRFAVAHEVGHQWWGISVNSDLRHHAYIVEGLTEFLTVEFWSWTDGEDVADAYLREVRVDEYVEVIETFGDQVADRTEGGDLGLAHVGIIYGKAALGFMAIHQAIGDEAFYEALRAYAAEYAFGITGPDDLLATFEAASGGELDDLWRHWFEEAETTPAEVRDLIRAA